MTRVGLVGFGLIGRERFDALRSLRSGGLDVEIAGICDPFNSEAQLVGEDEKIPLVRSVEELVDMGSEWIFVATPHDVATDLTIRALSSGCSVLLEKPLGRSAEEAKRILAAGEDRLFVGLNYRHFRGVSAALHDALGGTFGPLISVNLVLGHGGSPGMEKGWKFDPVRAGGGCLIDPGIHLLDLALLISSGELRVKGGTVWDGLWQAGIEEECRLLLTPPTGRPAISLDISIVRWRSTFRMEVHGENGYGVVNGRGRSYGPQTYSRGRRWGWRDAATQAESEELVVETSADDVFSNELRALFAPDEELFPPCSGRQALERMELLDMCRGALGLKIPSLDGAR